MQVRKVLVSLIAINIIFFALGFISAKFISFNNIYNTKAMAQDDVSPSPTPTPSSGGSNNSGSGSSFSNNSEPTPTPTINPVNAFAYTPLPANSGPENDIAQVGPISASRTTVQVDDSVTFSVQIKNQASYNKDIQSLCFESSDGNFGCIFGINLAPGQTYTASNVGTWTSGGSKRVWVTWTQDGRNFYAPANGSSVTINVLG